MKNVLIKTWSVLDKAERRKFLLLLVPDILLNLLDIAALAALVWIVQFYMQEDARVPRWMPAWIGDRHSISLIALFLCLFTMKNTAGWLLSKTWYRLSGRVAIRLSELNLEYYLAGSYRQFVNTDSSVHLRRIALQPFEFCQYLLSGMSQALTQLVLIILAMSAIILFNAELFLLLLAILLPPIVVVFYIVRKRLGHARNGIREGNEISTRYLLEALKGYVESAVFGKHRFFIQRFLDARDRFSRALFDSISLQNMPPRFIELFAVLGLFILITIATSTGGNEGTYILIIGAFMGAAYKIIPGTVKLINISGQMRAYAISLTDLKRETSRFRPGGNKKIQSVEVKDLSYRYEQEPVLEEIQFTARQGDLLALTGESGRGKTSLFHLLLGFLEPKGGSIIINGEYLHGGQLRDYWPAISYVRQQSFFLHDTLARNITLEHVPSDPQRLEEVISVTGLKNLCSEAGGYDKMIMENGRNLSGGQQQRVAIARALYKDADLYLLDEPFNELDDAATSKLLRYFRELASAGKTVILITHDTASLAYCNKIVSLDAITA